MIYKFLLVVSASFLLLFFSTNKLSAQAPFQKQYYIEIKNIDTKTLAKEVELLIKSKPTVTFFSGYKIPVAFHLLKTSKEITKAEFSEWLKPLALQVSVFEERELTTKFILSKKIGKAKTEKADVSTRKK